MEFTKYAESKASFGGNSYQKPFKLSEMLIHFSHLIFTLQPCEIDLFIENNGWPEFQGGSCL